MTARTFLQLWPSTAILTLLLNAMPVPFGPLRRWLQESAFVAENFSGGVTVYAPVRDSQMLTTWLDTEAEALAHLRRWERARLKVGELLACPVCTAAHVTFWSVLVFVPGSLWDRLCWWGPMWLSAAAAVFVILRLMDHE